uniref:Uncharacterized protein n=1 Tax=Peronospora matthiolae TaxID=2874970 RepID=A0AAV1TS60_9STRA
MNKEFDENDMEQDCATRSCGKRALKGVTAPFRRMSRAVMLANVVVHLAVATGREVVGIFLQSGRG